MNSSYLFVGCVLVGAAVEGQTHGFEAVHRLGVWADHDLATGVFGIRMELALPAGQLREIFATRL
jgi:hypothetical protein